MSSFWHKLYRVEDTVGVNKKSGTKGSIVVVVLSFQLRFPLVEKTSWKMFFSAGRKGRVVAL